MKQPPKVFVTISGVGFYKPSMTAEYTEESDGGDDFMAGLCRAWEAAAMLPPELGVRNVIIRSGVVLGKYGGSFVALTRVAFNCLSPFIGMIQQIYIPFYMGLGGPIGSGQQFFPWIHIDDMVNLFLFAIEEDVTGVLNGVAPQVITNGEFTKGLAIIVFSSNLNNSFGSSHVETDSHTTARIRGQTGVR